MGNTKVFKLSATVPMGTVTFGILGKRVWVTCENQDKSDSICSLDSPSRAVKLAARMLDVDLWPEFARPLAMSNTNQSALF